MHLNQKGFMSFCIPIGLMVVLFFVAWPAMLLDMAFNTSLFLPNWFLFGLGAVVDFCLIFFIGSIIDQRIKKKPHKHFYKILFIGGTLMACGMLYGLAYTGLVC